MKNIILLLILAFLGGCATVGGSVQSSIDYKFLDSYREHRLIEKNNDIYLEKLDGSESRQITHTPNTKESRAWFTKDGNYIVYWDETTQSGYGAYLVKREADDSKKILISEDEATKLMHEKIR